MPKISDAHRDARREQVAAAALARFAEKGFQRTSMADIIEASGLSAGAIYLHFESKQQIVLAVARRVLSRRLGDLQSVGDETPIDPVAMLELILDGMVDDLLDARLVPQVWGEATTDPELAALVTDIFATVRGALTHYLTAWAGRRGVADPGAWAASAIPVMLALAQGFILQRALLPGFDADDYFAAVRAVAGPGLLGPAT